MHFNRFMRAWMKFIWLHYNSLTYRRSSKALSLLYSLFWYRGGAAYFTTPPPPPTLIMGLALLRTYDLEYFFELYEHSISTGGHATKNRAPRLGVTNIERTSLLKKRVDHIKYHLYMTQRKHNSSVSIPVMS